jgi:hypothetical protein
VSTASSRADAAPRGVRHRMSKVGSTIVALASAIGVGTLLAPSAAADPSPAVQQAVVDARGAASCGPLNYDPKVERAADIVNRSTYTYLDHSAENVPADDAHPTAIVKDLGINANKVSSFQGAAHNEADAVKGVRLEGRNAIPDCSYTDFGVSLLHEPQSDFTLAVVVLVGT